MFRAEKQMKDDTQKELNFRHGHYIYWLLNGKYFNRCHSSFEFLFQHAFSFLDYDHYGACSWNLHERHFDDDDDDDYSYGKWALNVTKYSFEC